MPEISQNIKDTSTNIIIKLGIDDAGKSLLDLYLIFVIAIPISILAYLIFDKYRHKILVDLGQHKWIVRMK